MWVVFGYKLQGPVWVLFACSGRLEYLINQFTTDLLKIE